MKNTKICGAMGVLQNNQNNNVANGLKIKHISKRIARNMAFKFCTILSFLYYNLRARIGCKILELDFAF